MEITIDNNSFYDEGIHPGVTKITFRRIIAGDFFKGNRFPNLTGLICSNNGLTKLELDCPSLVKLVCAHNPLTELKLNCPSLQELCCHNNPLTNLNGLEFCTELKELYCSRYLKESAGVLKIHLPNLKVCYSKKKMIHESFHYYPIINSVLR